MRFIKRRILRFGVDLRQNLRVLNVDTGRNTRSEIKWNNFNFSREYFDKIKISLRLRLRLRQYSRPLVKLGPEHFINIWQNDVGEEICSLGDGNIPIL